MPEGYELIVGTGEERDVMAVAKAVEDIKDHLLDARGLDVQVYDNGGVGVDVSTVRKGLSEDFYGENTRFDGFERLESVEHFPIIEED
jgi:hypothetical protein